MLNKLLVEYVGTIVFLFTIVATGQPLAIVASLYILLLLQVVKYQVVILIPLFL